MLLPAGLSPASIPRSSYPPTVPAPSAPPIFHQLFQPGCSQPSFLPHLPSPDMFHRPGPQLMTSGPVSNGFFFPINPIQASQLSLKMSYTANPTVSSFRSPNLKIKRDDRTDSESSPSVRSAKSQSPRSSPKNQKLFRPWQTDDEDEGSQSKNSRVGSNSPDSQEKMPSSMDSSNPHHHHVSMTSGEFSPPRICGSRNDKVVVRNDDPFLKQQSALEIIATNLGKSRDGGHRCIYCGKVYSRKYGLKIHLRTHTGFKPLKCKVCDRAFGDPSNLNKHTRLHSENGLPFKCHLCDKVLVRKRDLDRHLVSRHDCPSSAAIVPSDDEDTVAEDEVIEQMVDVESP